MASASKQGHENLESYVDNLRVKISERYKPPPRINVAMTYAQRLTLNKHIQDNMPNYEFVLEKAVLEKIREWKSVRKSTFDERKAKVVEMKSELKRKQIESIEQQKLDEVELKTVENPVAVPKSDKYITEDVAFASSSINNQNYAYTTADNILMPTQVRSNYSSILTPIPLAKSANQPYKCKPADKSPFNVSDFENDTSSPFDNMELKSINDLEELAQVLKSEESKYKMNVNPPMYQPYQTVSAQTAGVGSMQQNIPSYLGYTYSIPDNVSYVQPVISDYSHTNGYFYSNDIVPQNESFSSPYSYSKPMNAGYREASQTSFVEAKRASCKSVPDIVKSLEMELENSHLDSNSSNSACVLRGQSTPLAGRPRSTEAVIYDVTKGKEDDLDNPFNSLPKVQQDLCRSIGSMGFPLSRVARTCQIVGNDQKKIVEHLLAMSDLLDLGFSEKAVSEALLQCDNDRDKALDKLIL